MGAYAESRNLPEARLIRLPDAITERVAGGAMLRGLTAHMLLHKVYRVGPGDWILVHAAAGGLGQIVTRWAKRLGAQVIGTVGSEAKRAAAESAGADAVLLHTDDGWVDEARRITNGAGAHFAIDGIGGAMLVRTLAAVRPFGVVASIGRPAGPVPAVAIKDLPPAVALTAPSVLAYANDPAFYRPAADALFVALQAGLIHPIGAEYPLREAARAHADLGAGRTVGGVILTV
jgi:NADPH2:quinone reductase